MRADRRTLGIVVAALLAGGGVVALVLTSDQQDAKVVWAVFGPVVGWSFIGTGLYAERRRPESRVGLLMILLGFAWMLSALGLANAPLPYSVGEIVGGLWGALFLQLVVTFPSGRLQSRADRAIVVAGYLVFTVATVPSMFVAAPEDYDCARCPTNVLLIERDATLAKVALAFQAASYAVLLVIVLARLVMRWRRSGAPERMQLTPVYTSGLLTFLLVTVGQLGVGQVAWWAAFIATALLPFAFLAGLLRSHVARLDSELRARLQELRTSRTRLVEVGDSERRRLERNLHDGAQGRLIAVLMLLGQARTRAGDDVELAETLDLAIDELKTSLAELRELARGLHPPLLTEKGLEPAVEALAARAPVPVLVDSDSRARLPSAVEITAYYVVSEALANVAKYARASEAVVIIRRGADHVAIEVSDDGIGGADPFHGSGLAGLTDRLEALNGTLAVQSPPGEGTRLHAQIPYGGAETSAPPAATVAPAAP